MSFTRRTFSAFSLGAVFAPGSLVAQSAGTQQSGALPLTVVELFTSQGCSSCPAADALMLEMSKQANVISLTFPVEIWDYVGWKDTLAKPAFTKRQKAYAAMVAGKRIYTPQAIVNGRAHCVGSDISALTRLKTSTARDAGAKLGVEKTADGWVATVAAGSDAAQAARLILLPLISRQTVKIGRGENSGRTVTYGNVVREIVDLGVLGAVERKVQIAAKDVVTDGADGFALLVQAGTTDAPAAVLTAALVDSASRS
ncbi:MAG: DUF1223 domain-containing protein [Rhizobiales bacterium PAR1]|nr:MAG: DUF1223 domain-containing protein [Rhizobiales bacterium PAR1]